MSTEQHGRKAYLIRRSTESDGDYFEVLSSEANGENLKRIDIDGFRREFSTLLSDSSDSRFGDGAVFDEIFEETRIAEPAFKSDMEAAFRKIAEAMVSGPVSEMPQTPAGYTYFGQLLAHEMMQTHVRGDFSVSNYISPQIDLDSVYRRLVQQGHSEPRVRLGATNPNAGLLSCPFDIPRECDGTPDIGNRRNDDNLVLAQLHMTLLRFHNAIADNSPDATFEQIRKQVVLWFQSMIVHEYLPMIVGRRLVDKIRKGRRFWRPDQKSGCPLELAMAIFRFGHSMVREDYKPWSTNQLTTPTNLKTFLEHTKLGNPRSTDYKLDSDWVVDWSRMFSFEQQPPPLRAAAIDTNLTSWMFDINSTHLTYDKTERGLAFRTLKLGAKLPIVSGLGARSALCAELGHEEFPFDKDDLTAPGDRFDSIFREYPELRELPPLWFYILREAEHQTGGESLSGVGARILVESVVGALEVAEISIFNTPLDGRLLGTSDPEGCTMSRLIKIAGGPNFADQTKPH